MATKMLQRRGTAAEWAAANPVLGAGEMGFVTDTREVRIGDGVTAFASLPSITVALARNAELLDGFNTATASTVNTVAVRDASGDIATRLLRSEYTTLSTTPNYVMAQHAAGGAGTDNYIRPVSLAQLRNSLGKMNDSNLLDGLDSTAFLRSTAKAADSDKLDGLDSTAFLKGTVSATAPAAPVANDLWVDIS